MQRLTDLYGLLSSWPALLVSSRLVRNSVLERKKDVCQLRNNTQVTPMHICTRINMQMYTHAFFFKGVKNLACQSVHAHLNLKATQARLAVTCKQ